MVSQQGSSFSHFPLVVLRFGSCFFLFFSLQNLSRFFNDFEVKTLVSAGKSIKMCCCKCYQYVKEWSLCHHLLTAAAVVFFSHISQKVSLSKYFFLLLENISSLLLGPLSLEQFHFEHVLQLTQFRSQLMKFPGNLSI